ncbi:hypothetical protein M378DRAFT_70206 [Amanita muscaria Koide BX008]|uniref:BTB domain-containing protein n=1 Tax=Amanita muscaria (strain Koide BX008) TaxID=946122 RepID=A0A0C2T079_AMAMK|nr:hypothetical protein M378DRAFT_70206 [Amanita muscaria Koide BX008]
MSQNHLLTAPPPFDDRSADLILRCSDNVDFYVHRSILQLSSPVFASMFSLPQPAQADEKQPVDNVIEVSDDSRVFYRLLSWMDPRGHLYLSDLEDAAAVLMLAEKYDLETVKSRLLAFVFAGREGLKRNPNELFALGTRFHHEELADFAARELLRFPVTKWLDSPLLTLITGRDQQALMHYFFHCQQVAKSQVKDWLQWVGPDLEDLVWKGIQIGWNHNHCTFKQFEGRNYPEWWILYQDAISRALWETPSADVLNAIENFAITAPAAYCSKCKPKYVSDLQTFNNLLADRLDTMIPRCGTLHTQSTLRILII